MIRIKQKNGAVKEDWPLWGPIFYSISVLSDEMSHAFTFAEAIHHIATVKGQNIRTKMTRDKYLLQSPTVNLSVLASICLPCDYGRKGSFFQLD